MNLERIDLWERIDKDGFNKNITTARLAVTGGWLYRVTMNSTVGPGVAVTTTFVADPDADKTVANRIAAEEQARTQREAERTQRLAARQHEWQTRHAQKSDGVR